MSYYHVVYSLFAACCLSLRPLQLIVVENRDVIRVYIQQCEMWWLLFIVDSLPELWNVFCVLPHSWFDFKIYLSQFKGRTEIQKPEKAVFNFIQWQILHCFNWLLRLNSVHLKLGLYFPGGALTYSNLISYSRLQPSKNIAIL